MRPVTRSKPARFLIVIVTVTALIVGTPAARAGSEPVAAPLPCRGRRLGERDEQCASI